MVEAWPLIGDDHGHAIATIAVADGDRFGLVVLVTMAMGVEDQLLGAGHERIDLVLLHAAALDQARKEDLGLIDELVLAGDDEGDALPQRGFLRRAVEQVVLGKVEHLIVLGFSIYMIKNLP